METTEEKISGLEDAAKKFKESFGSDNCNMLYRANNRLKELREQLKREQASENYISMLREMVQTQGQRITVLENDLRMLMNEVRGTGSFAPDAIAEKKKRQRNRESRIK